MSLCVKSESWENYKTCNVAHFLNITGKAWAVIKILSDVSQLSVAAKKKVFFSKSLGKTEIGFIRRSFSWSVLVSICTSWQETSDILSLTSKEQKIIMNLQSFTPTGFWRPVRVRPLVPVCARVSSQNTWLTRKCKGLISNVWGAKRLSSGTDSLLHSFSMLMLFILVLYVSLSCTSLCVKRRVDVEMCVCVAKTIS